MNNTIQVNKEGKFERWDDLPDLCRYSVLSHSSAESLYTLLKAKDLNVRELPDTFWIDRIKEHETTYKLPYMFNCDLCPMMIYFKISIPLCFCCNNKVNYNFVVGNRNVLFDRIYMKLYGIHVCDHCEQTDERMQLLGFRDAKYAYRLSKNSIVELQKYSWMNTVRRVEVIRLFEKDGGQARIDRLNKVNAAAANRREERRLLERMRQKAEEEESLRQYKITKLNEIEEVIRMYGYMSHHLDEDMKNQLASTYYISDQDKELIKAKCEISRLKEQHALEVESLKELSFSLTNTSSLQKDLIDAKEEISRLKNEHEEELQSVKTKTLSELFRLHLSID